MKVAINGLGRIGRAVFKILQDIPELELVLKVMSMYDNEWGYTNQMIREARLMAKIDHVLQGARTP